MSFKEGSRTPHKSQAVGKNENVEKVILCELCVNPLTVKMSNLCDAHS